MQQVATTQAAQESNLLGKPSGLATNNNNLFGITGTGNAGSTTKTGNLDSSPQQFAAYKTPQDSMDAYKKLMSDPRYASVAAAKTPNEAYQALQQAGYATDPKYAQNLTDLSKNIHNPVAQIASVTNATNAAANPGANPYSVAKAYLGDGVQAHTEALTGFFKSSGVGNINPKTTPWCAAFANSVLKSTGLQGTGSLAARSFLNYGQSSTNPQQGDIVVMKDMVGNDPAKGHVGFYSGTETKNGQQYVSVLGGNQSGQVSVKSYKASNVLDIRTPPTSGEIQQKASQAHAPGAANASQVGQTPGLLSRSSPQGSQQPSQGQPQKPGILAQNQAAQNQFNILQPLINKNQ